MAVLTLTAAALPAAYAGLAGVASGASSNGVNSAAYTYAGGAPGAGDTITNTELLKGVSTSSRLYAFLTTNFASQGDVDATVAALGIMTSGQSATLFRFVREAVGGPSATATTAVATGSLRVSISQSITQ
jgi:hypothetical protein